MGTILIASGVACFAFLMWLVVRDRRSVRARDISGQVIVGDVNGDVVQHQAPADRTSTDQRGPSPLVNWINVSLAIVASGLTIVGVLLKL